MGKQPINSLGLSGTYVHDVYSDVVNGVVEYSIVPSPVKLTFTDEIYTPSASFVGDFGGYFRGIVDYNGLGSAGYAELFDDMSYFVDPVNDMSFFRYQVSDTHLFSQSSMNERYKIQVLNQNELVLRNHTSCNSYEEYHFTKIN